jgi:hypothetical protein
MILSCMSRYEYIFFCVNFWTLFHIIEHELIEQSLPGQLIIIQLINKFTTRLEAFVATRSAKTLQHDG